MANVKIEHIIAEIIEKNDIEKLNGLVSKAEENQELRKSLLEIFAKNEMMAYYVLINSEICNEFLKKVKKKFTNGKTYFNIIKFMKHPDINVKKFFLREFGKAKSEIFNDIFIEALKSKDWLIRKEVAEILSKHNDDSSINLLMTMIDDFDRRVVKEAILYLAEKGERVLLFVDKYIEVSMDRAKINLLDLLNKINSPGALKYIIQLCGDESEKVRIEAQKLALFLLEKNSPVDDIDGYKTIFILLAHELKKLDINNSATIIKIILKFKEEGAKIIEQDMEEKWANIDEYKKILSEIKSEDKVYIIQRMLESSRQDVRKKGLEILLHTEIKADIEEKIIDIIINYISDYSHKLDDKWKELISSYLIKNRLFEKIAPMINSTEAKERRTAVIIISMVSNDEKLYEIILKLLKDPIVEVRKEALKALIETGKEDYIKYYEELLQDPEDSIQIEALRAIAMFDNNISKQIIIKTMGHPNVLLREEAVKLIARESLKKYIDSFDTLDEVNKKRVGILIEKMGPKTEEILYKEIKSTDIEIRRRVIEIIKYIKDKYKFKEIMKQAMKDPDKKIRASVVKFLVNVSDRELLLGFLKLLNDPDSRVRANTIEAFATVGAEGSKVPAELLYQFLKDEDNRIRANAIMALYQLGYKEVIDEVDEMLLSKSELMRASGVYAVGVLKAKEKRKIINSMLDDPSELVRKNIVITLYKIGEEDKIEKFLKDSSIEVAETAKKYFKLG